MVTVEPFLFALTSTPSIGPSSVELTCPVSASPGEFAAPVRSGPKKNSAAAAVTMTNAKKVFLSIRTSPRPDSVLKRPRGGRPLLTLRSSARQAYVGRRRGQVCWDHTGYFCPEVHGSRDTKKTKESYAAGRWESPLAL